MNLKYVDDFCGKTHDLRVSVKKYSKPDNVAIQLYEFDEDCGCYLPYAMLTTNTLKKREEGCSLVDTNNLGWENTWKMIRDSGIGSPTGKSEVSGFCEYPEYRWDFDVLKKYEVGND